MFKYGNLSKNDFENAFLDLFYIKIIDLGHVGVHCHVLFGLEQV